MKIKFLALGFTAILAIMVFFPATNINAATEINVSLDASSPAAGNVSAGQTYPLAVFNFPNSSLINLITKLKFHIIGTAGASSIKSVKLTWVGGIRNSKNNDFGSLPINSDGTVVFDFSDFCWSPRESGGAGCGIQTAGNAVGKGVAWGTPQPSVFKVEATFTDTTQTETTVGIALDSVTTSYIDWSGYDSGDKNKLFDNPVISKDNPVSVSGNLMTFASFTGGGQPSINLIYPTDANTIWQGGKTYEIKWEASNVSKDVYITLVDDILGKTKIIAGPIAANTKTFSFVVPDRGRPGSPTYLAPGDKYKIKVGNNDVFDISKNYFKISAGKYTSYLTITSPLGGENLQAGKNYKVKWIAGNWAYDVDGNNAYNYVSRISLVTYDDANNIATYVLWQPNVPGYGSYIKSGSATVKIPTDKTLYKNNKLVATLTIKRTFDGDVYYIDSGVFSITNDSVDPGKEWCNTFKDSLFVGVLKPEQVKALQKALTKEGLYTGAINGVYDKTVYSAVSDFQKKNNMRATGYVGAPTRVKLNAIYGCKDQQSLNKNAEPNFATASLQNIVKWIKSIFKIK